MCIAGASLPSKARRRFAECSGVLYPFAIGARRSAAWCHWVHARAPARAPAPGQARSSPPCARRYAAVSSPPSAPRSRRPGQSAAACPSVRRRAASSASWPSASLVLEARLSPRAAHVPGVRLSDLQVAVQLHCETVSYDTVFVAHVRGRTTQSGSARTCGGFRVVQGGGLEMICSARGPRY
jgi:hypothetical protein